MLIGMDCITGRLQEKVVLWENASPTSAFADQTITLSDDISNYDQIEFELRYSTTDGRLQHVYINASDLLNVIGVAGGFAYYSGGIVIGNTGYTRPIIYSSITQIRIMNAYGVNKAENYTNYAIPTRIIGVKKGYRKDEGVKIDEESTVNAVWYTTGISIPTYKKAKGVIVVWGTSPNYAIATNVNGIDDNHMRVNGVLQSNARQLVYTDNAITCNEGLGSSNLNVTCKIIYD